MPKFKPNVFELRMIRDQAISQARKWGYPGIKVVVIEPGFRYNVNDGRGNTINIREVSSHPTWDDTDLQTTGEWKTDFVDGFNLTDDSEALIDFYVYEKAFKSEHGDLICNIQAEFDQNGLRAIHADMDKDIWVRT